MFGPVWRLQRRSLTSPVWSADGQRLLLPRLTHCCPHAGRIQARPDRARGRPTARPRALADGRVVYLSHSVSAPMETKLLDAGSSIGRVILPSGDGSEAEVSPDRRWLAFTAPATSPRNVVVQAFPGPGLRMPVSPSGLENDPVWSADGRTLYYINPLPDRGGAAILSVDIAGADGAITASTPRELFRHPQSQTCGGRCYDISDGPRFLLRETFWPH